MKNQAGTGVKGKFAAENQVPQGFSSGVGDKADFFVCWKFGQLPCLIDRFIQTAQSRAALTFERRFCYPVRILRM